MKLCLDNTFVSDYIEGRSYTKKFLSNLPENSSVFIPTIVEFEALVPAFRAGSTRTLAKVKYAISGFKSVDFGTDEAYEAAQIRSYLLDNGMEVGSPDVQIAGVARELDATIVTSNVSHFSRIPNLSVNNPKP